MKTISGGLRAAALSLTGALALAGCDLLAAKPPATPPRARPAGLIKPPAPPPVQAPSDESQALARYYGRVQADLLTQGLLRVDGGGPDTPYRADDLVANFERIAFFDEYEREGGLTAASGKAGHLRRWESPVRMNVEFGATVSAAQRKRDKAYVQRFGARLSRITGHPISFNAQNPNFHVFFLGEDDRAAALPRIREIVPNISPASMNVLRDIPRSIHCLVIAFSAPNRPNEYGQAIALVRNEHPDLLRNACIHEELAQGLGLANDSPYARPSIFNDDDEFALLTTHDEMLLKILYDPRLSAGISADKARPVVRILARELTGGPL